MRGKGKTLLKKGLPLPPRPHPHLQNFLIGGRGSVVFWAALPARRFPKVLAGNNHSMAERAFTTGRMSAIRSVVSYFRD